MKTATIKVFCKGISVAKNYLRSESAPLKSDSSTIRLLRCIATIVNCIWERILSLEYQGKVVTLMIPSIVLSDVLN